jgi:hypothetical protein
MKKLILALLSPFLVDVVFSQNVGIGTTAPHQSAALDVSDTAKGILIPRMTMNQRVSIQNPAEGLMVYQKDNTKGYYYFSGNEWQSILPDDKISKRLKTYFFISSL